MTFVRQGVVRLAGVFAVMSCALLSEATPLVYAQESQAASIPFGVAMITTIALTESIRAVATSEVRAIWEREGVRIAIGTIPPAGVGVGMRVLVVSSADGSPGRDGHHWPVAELLRDGEGRPLAIASVAAARRVVRAARLASEPAVLTDRRVGVVLGRAIAHEIGHFLLDTTGHARRGLMRARIEADEFVDLRTGGFGLDDEAAVRARSALIGPPAANALLSFASAP